MSFLVALECTNCGVKHQANRIQNLCSQCGSPLFARYNTEAIGQVVNRETFKNREPTLWRYREFLPVLRETNMVTLGEGFSPLLRATRLAKKLGLQNLWIKDESTIPTGTFKARGFAVAVSKAKELGVNIIAVPSAGNAAGAAAVYGARAGMKVYVFLPEDAPVVNKLEAYMAGASVYLVKGLISDAGKIVVEGVEKKGWFNMSTFKEPYRVEGKKTMGLEIAEQLGWQLPDIILYPTGGGTGLVGMWKAFEELEKTGLTSEKRPRMVSIQSEGCAPIVKAFLEGKSRAEFWKDAATIAAGLRVPKPLADALILKTLRDSDGTAVAVGENELLDGVREMAREEGIFTCPEGGATLAGLKVLLERGWVDRDETIVLLSTGSGLKYLEAFSPTLQTLDPQAGVDYAGLA